MGFLSDIWAAITGAIASALTLLEGVLEPLFGVHAWGWAIIGLTLIVRFLMLPLAIKQTRSMKGMQAIQPKVKEIQKKYKVDRDLLKKDPEAYQKRKQEMNQKLMELYKEEGVNPASSCLPLLLQMPIFFALFTVLDPGRSNGLAELANASFYFFTGFIGEGATATGLGASINQAGWPGYLLIVAMSATMFLTQRQMMARNTAEGPAATQQKIMMYVFPVFLAVISLNFPLAVVLYWVTTNLWQSVQQYLMFRTVADETPGASTPGSTPAARSDDDASTSKKKSAAASSAPSKPAKKKPSSKASQSGHLPKRRTS